jgi:hypothetical protein
MRLFRVLGHILAQKVEIIKRSWLAAPQMAEPLPLLKKPKLMME